MVRASAYDLESREQVVEVTESQAAVDRGLVRAAVLLGEVDANLRRFGCWKRNRGTNQSPVYRSPGAICFEMGWVMLASGLRRHEPPPATSALVKG